MKLLWGLNVVVHRVDIAPEVIKVHVRGKKDAIFLEKVLDFSEFFGLMRPHIFKHALGYDDIELLAAETDAIFDEVDLDEVGGRGMNCHINAVVIDIGA